MTTKPLSIYLCAHRETQLEKNKIHYHSYIDKDTQKDESDC